MKRQRSASSLGQRLALFLALLVLAPITFGQLTHTVGTGTTSAVSSTPIYRSSPTSSFDFSRMKNLYTRADLVAIPDGAQITGIEFYKDSAGATNAPHANIAVYLRNQPASMTTVAAGGNIDPDINAATQVFANSSFELTAATGWTSIGPFNQGTFTYTGGALEVITDWDISAPNPATTSSIAWRYNSRTNSGEGSASSSKQPTFSTDSRYKDRLPHIRITYIPGFEIAAFTLPRAKAGLPWQGPAMLNVAGAATPLAWSIERVSNADWMNITPTTGFLEGTPPKSLAGLTATFRVTVVDDNGFGMNTHTVEKQLLLEAIPSIPYFNDFESGNALDNFEATFFPSSGVSARVQQHAQGSVSANGLGIMLDSNDPNGVWQLNPESDVANIAVLEDPTKWFPGVDPKDPSNHHGIASILIEAPKVKELQIDFDLKMAQGSTLTGADRRTQFIVEVSEDNGGNWIHVAGPLANAAGIYQGKTTGFVAERILIQGLSGNQEFISVRLRWLTRYTFDKANFATFVAIDNLSINAPLALAAETLPNAQETAPYNFAIAAIGGEPPYTNFSITSGTLPQGMVFVQQGNDWFLRADAHTITSGTAGNYNLDIEVTDSANDTATRSYTLTVRDAPPAIQINNLPVLPSAGAGLPYQFTLTAAGGIQFPGGKYRWTMLGTNANWLSFDPNDTFSGRLVGTPPIGGAGGQVQFSVRVEDVIGDTFDSGVDFSIDVVGELTILSPSALRNATEGSTYREALSAVGGQPPYQWSFVSGDVPPGLALDPLKGRLVGAAERNARGVYNFRLLATDSGTQMKEQDFSLEIVQSSTTTFDINSPSQTPAGGVGADFSFAIDAVGGNPPYVWSALPGTMPPGLSITSTGEIVGNPTAGSANTYNTSIQVTDALNQTTTQIFVIEVEPEVLPVSILTNASLPKRREGTFFVQTISADGGVPPFTWEFLDDLANLPSGVQFSQAGSSAVISGLPQLNSLGNYSFRLRVTDSAQQVAEKTFSLVVDAIPSGNELGIVWASPANILPKGREGDSYGLTMMGSGGVAPYTWSLAPGSTPLPAGLALNTFGALSGSPVGSTKGVYTFTMRIHDAIGGEADRSFTIEVLGAEEDPNAGGGATTPVVGSVSSNGGCSLSWGPSGGVALLMFLLLMVMHSRRYLRQGEGQ